jgi:hypothetical protein
LIFTNGYIRCKYEIKTDILMTILIYVIWMGGVGDCDLSTDQIGGLVDIQI